MFKTGPLQRQSFGCCLTRLTCGRLFDLVTDGWMVSRSIENDLKDDINVFSLLKAGIG